MSERFNIFDNLHPANSKLTEYEEHLELVKEEFNIEILNEDVVYEEPKISIHVDPTINTNFKYDPYIKVYNGPFRNATKNVRIYLKDAGLDYSHKDRGKQFGNLSMTTKIADELNRIMDLKIERSYIDAHNVRKTRSITVYNYIWAIIHSRVPDAPYINKPNFRNFYERKK